MKDGIPALITMRELALAMNWHTRRVKRLLLRNGAAVKHNEHWYTTPELLRGTMPETWREVWLRIQAARAASDD